jgi:hypothetical protein
MLKNGIVVLLGLDDAQSTHWPNWYSLASEIVLADDALGVQMLHFSRVIRPVAALRFGRGWVDEER